MESRDVAGQTVLRAVRIEPSPENVAHPPLGACQGRGPGSGQFCKAVGDGVGLDGFVEGCQGSIYVLRLALLDSNPSPIRY